VSFHQPLALLALLVVPVLAVLYVLRERRRDKVAAKFGNPDLMPNVVDRSPGWRRQLPAAVLLVALAAMIVGVARPHATVTVKRQEATVVLALDVSRSMEATDVRPSRIAAARRAAAEFLDSVPDKYRVGLISIGTRAVLTVPPTTDRDLVRQGLAELEPSEGTALGDAVALTARLAGRQHAADGTITPTTMLVISDGKRDGGRVTPQAAATQARRQHVPVYTALVGTPNGVVTRRLQGGFTEQIRVPASPGTLQLLARETGGTYFAAPTSDRLRQVYRQLGSRLGNKKEDREITDLFAGGSAILMLAGVGLSAFWFRRVL
jgi:Ca-activated chloride channel family protein